MKRLTMIGEVTEPGRRNVYKPPRWVADALVGHRDKRDVLKMLRVLGANGAVLRVLGAKRGA